jgi:hypothetical protein
MTEKGEETITITVGEYEKLKEDQRFLDALRSCGVDNWEGFDDAVDRMEEDD